MTTPRCPVKIKAWPTASGEFQCRLAASSHNEHREHVASGISGHQTIHWYDGDRRQFRGEFVPCDQSTCILPSGHHGDHAE